MAELTTFKIYYSSRTGPDGTMWCPDCIAVEETLNKIFVRGVGPKAETVYVGDRATWKDPNNFYRKEPLNVSGVPTVLRFRDGKVVGKIDGTSILDEGKMGKFLAEEVFIEED